MSAPEDAASSRDVKPAGGERFGPCQRRKGRRVGHRSRRRRTATRRNVRRNSAARHSSFSSSSSSSRSSSSRRSGCGGSALVTEAEEVMWKSGRDVKCERAVCSLRGKLQHEQSNSWNTTSRRFRHNSRAVRSPPEGAAVMAHVRPERTNDKRKTRDGS